MGKVSHDEIYENTRPAIKETIKTATPRSCRLWWCLGITCFLLLGSIAVNIWITMAMNKQKATIKDLAAENKHLVLENRNLTNQTDHLVMEKRSLIEEAEQLMEKTRIMENQIAELSREKDNLNWTLEVILTFDNFPVKDFCPNTKCKPCLDGWMVFKDRCYLFYFGLAPWKTWEESRQYCQNQKADLVVIDSLEEQEFVSNHSSYYYDNYHGYWLGLRHINNNWTWVDGRIDTLKYWIEEGFDSSRPFALLIPGRNYMENWKQRENVFINRFVCEHKALIRFS